MKKEYIGDGVYITIDNLHQIVLTTENGIKTTNTIYLELDHVDMIVDYTKRFQEIDK